MIYWFISVFISQISHYTNKLIEKEGHLKNSMLPSHHSEQSIFTIESHKENVASSQRSHSVSYGGSRNSINSQRSGGTGSGNAGTTASGTAKRLNNVLDANKKQGEQRHGDDNFSSSVLQTVFALVCFFLFVFFLIFFVCFCFQNLHTVEKKDGYDI